jgi:hypothetical protein
VNRFDTTDAGLRQIIDNGESATVEFRSRPQPDGVTAALIAAFANSDGGLLLVGVEDNGKVVGLRPKEAREAASRIKSIAFNLVGDPIEGGVADIDGYPVVYAVIPRAPDHRRPVIAATDTSYGHSGEIKLRAEDVNSEETPFWDVFISHASEDKDVIVRPLADELQRRGLKVWYDEFSLSLGDSLRRSIDKGLTRSRFGVVVLSRNFFTKEWPQRELDGLTSREIAGGKIILPVWHDVSHNDVAVFSPTLADRVAIPSAAGVDAIADAVQKVVIQGTATTSTVGLGTDSPRRSQSNAGNSNRPPARPDIWTRFSKEAFALASLLNKRSKNGIRLDAQVRIDALAVALGLSDEDVKIAIDELYSAGLLKITGAGETVFPTDRLFWDTDPLFGESDPRSDAQLVARALVEHTADTLTMAELATRLHWSPRRLNPATSFLVQHGGAQATGTLASAPYRYYQIRRTSMTGHTHW